MKTLAVNKKRLVIRAALVVLLVVLCFVLYYAGKEHEILVDNKAADIDGIRYEPLGYVKVYVDGKIAKPITLSSGERSAIKVGGPRHTIKAEIIDKRTDMIMETAERSFNFGKVPVFMISVPALAKNAPGVYLPLPGKAAQAAPAPPPAEPPAPSADPDGEMETPLLSD